MTWPGTNIAMPPQNIAQKKTFSFLEDAYGRGDSHRTSSANPRSPRWTPAPFPQDPGVSVPVGEVTCERPSLDAIELFRLRFDLLSMLTLGLCTRDWPFESARRLCWFGKHRQNSLQGHYSTTKSLSK